MLSTVPNLQAMAAVAYTPAANGFYILEPKAGCKTVSVCVCAALWAKAFSQAPGSKRPLPSFDPWFQRPDGQMQSMNRELCARPLSGLRCLCGLHFLVPAARIARQPLRRGTD